MRPLFRKVNLLRFALTAAALAALLSPRMALAAAGEVDPEVPPLKKLDTDLSEYRRFTLDNGIKVILLSDPKLNKSSASLHVSAGSLSDPRERQGLAHFLEHMLFLGTEKYPDVAEYGQYLQTNGGYNNAYTADDHTNYLFEIRHEAFEGAIDRFAQFFIAPLFTAEFTAREMNAVNSENQKNLENDARRGYQVRRSLYRADHPANHFSTGNKSTLEGTTREELLAFYQKYYSADRMTLAMVGKASLDQMEQWARQYFSPVVNRALGPLRFDPTYLQEKAALRVVRIEPIADVRQLSIEFPMPATEQYWASKPTRLLGLILGYEGEGSLLSQLKAEGLATGLSAGGSDETLDYGSFEMMVQLTPDGQKKYDRVLELAFATIAEMKRSGYPAYLFQERKTMAGLNELYQDKGEGSNRAVFLANQIAGYPLAVAERVPYLFIREDAGIYNKLLSYLRPDNMLVAITAKDVETDSTEKYYGTKYSYREETGAAFEKLTKAVATPSVAAIRLPAVNPYIPAEAAIKTVKPVRLIDEPGLSLYYAQDNEFGRPMVTQIFSFKLPRSMVSLENRVALTYYTACVNEAVNEITYVAGEAGLSCNISGSLTDGVTVVVTGYDESAGRLLDTMTTQLRDFKLSDERFAALKERIVREYRNFSRIDAYQTVMTTRAVIENEFAFRPDEMVATAERFTLGDVRAFARKLYTTGKIEALVYGNAFDTDAVAAARRFASAIRAAAPSSAKDLMSPRVLVLGSGDEVRSSEKLLVNNSAINLRYRLGDVSPELRAAASTIGLFVREPFYTELRTRQQLGYIVNAGATANTKESSVIFLIQSGNHPADELEAKALAFIETLPAQLRALSDAEWQQIVGGARSRLEEKDKTIAQRASRLYTLAYEYDGDWVRREETLAALNKLTKERAAEILSAALASKTRQQITILGFARNHEPVDAAAVKPTFAEADRSAWKKKQTYR